MSKEEKFNMQSDFGEIDPRIIRTKGRIERKQVYTLAFGKIDIALQVVDIEAPQDPG